MRLSSTYHLYKIALLVKTADAAKDSVILKAGESSKALYFIVSGTVEVIQVICVFRLQSGRGVSERNGPSDRCYRGRATLSLVKKRHT